MTKLRVIEGGLKESRREREESVPFCAECRWFTRGNGAHGVCMYPPFWREIEEGGFVSATMARAYDNACGIHGRHFEQRQTFLSKLASFFRRKR